MKREIEIFRLIIAKAEGDEGDEGDEGELVSWGEIQSASAVLLEARKLQQILDGMLEQLEASNAPSPRRWRKSERRTMNCEKCGDQYPQELLTLLPDDSQQETGWYCGSCYRPGEANAATEKKSDGGPAFPQSESWGTSRPVPGGMTLRQYFAGQAMMGTLANPDLVDQPSHVAECSVEQADALIAELEKENDD